MGDDAAILLELSATDNLEGFKHAVEYQGFHVDQVGLWYGRRIGSRNMGFQKMTPLFISSIYGSFRVLDYILKTGKVDVNRPSVGSDGATALHFAAASGLDSSAEVVEILIKASAADVNALDVNGNRPIDLIAPRLKNSSHLKRRKLEMLFRGETGGEEEDEEKETAAAAGGVEKKEYAAIDDVPFLPDINNGIYSTDDFRMYSFKVKTCSRAYSHDWTECPFVHPGENARRRDPTKFQYTCVPCPEFRKSSCVKGDTCEFAHGVFESWLHPAQYRTRLCKDETTGCSRKICFFAHKRDELRPLYASTGSALPSPKTDLTPPMSPSAANSWANKPRPSRLKTARELELELQLINFLENQRQLSGLSSSPYSNRMSELKSTNLEPFFTLSSSSSSPIRKSSPYGFDFESSVAAMAGGMNSRSSAFVGNRSQSFIDRGAAVNNCNRPVSLGLTAAANSSKLAEWGSPDGKLEWGFSKEEEMNRLKKSASFAYRRNENVTKTTNRTAMAPPTGLSWVHSNLPWSSAQQFYMFEQEKISA